MMTHTKGPWESKVFDDGSLRVVHGHIAIADTFGNEANARLIAVAPELLDELKRAVERASWEGITGAREVIAKAEGR